MGAKDQDEARPERNFFISYTGKDKAWAEWLAWVIEEAGYTTCVQAWDFAPGCDWVHEMREALRYCERVVAVLSGDYLNSDFAAAEWAEAFRKDPVGKGRALIPIRVDECDPGPLFNTRVYGDLVGREEAAAQECVRGAVAMSRVKPASPSPKAVKSTKPIREGDSVPRMKPSVRPRFPGPRSNVPSPASPSPSPSPAPLLRRSAAETRQPVLSFVQRKMKILRVSDLLLHTFHGLSPRPIQKAPPDFTSIYYLWADAEGSQISASLEPKEPPETGLRHFAVKFVNAPGTYSCNAAFRPGGTSALDNAPGTPSDSGFANRYLSFEARRPRPKRGGLEVIGMGYRVIDRMGTHWMLQRGARIDRVNSTQWAPFNIDLGDRAWSVFTSDGNYLYARNLPDFSLIVAVVIDFGSDEGDGEPPGDGEGEVHVRNFRLRETPLLEAD